jgi:hypothetical protein
MDTVTNEQKLLKLKYLDSLRSQLVDDDVDVSRISVVRYDNNDEEISQLINLLVKKREHLKSQKKIREFLITIMYTVGILAERVFELNLSNPKNWFVHIIKRINKGTYDKFGEELLSWEKPKECILVVCIKMLDEIREFNDKNYCANEKKQ